MDTRQAAAFGTLLRRYRVAAGLTQEELAERATISRRNLGDLERGVGHSPRKDTIALLAEALALTAQQREPFAEAARRVGTAWMAGFAPEAVAGTSAPPFVGRKQELALLERHLRGEGPPMLLLAGEPGIGKTRLLHAAIPRAVAQGIQVLQGGCQRRGGQQPYAPLLGALQRYIRSRRPVHLRAELQGCAWLVRLLPELAGGSIPPLPPWRLPPEQEHRLMNEAVARFLTNVAGPDGTLLVLDDLQWASPDAIALLETLVRTAAEAPLRILGAYRDTEVRPRDPLADLLADLAHAGLAARRLLGPLASAEATKLLDSLLTGGEDEERSRRELVLRRSGGVPFFVVSYARAVQLGDQDDAVPWDIGQSVRQRVATLSERAQELVHMAAVIGRVAPRRLLTSLATRSEGDLVAAFDAIAQARLFEDLGEDAYQFTHDVIREVVEANLGTARRMHLHLRVAEVLERQSDGRSVELLAYHYGRSSAQDKAITYLEPAGAQAQAQYAYAAAEAYYRELIERLDNAGRAHDGARAREKLGAILNLTTHYVAAREVLEQAVATMQLNGDLEGLVSALAQLGRMHAAHGIPEGGLARIQPLLETLATQAPSPGLAALYAALAWLFLASGRCAESAGAAERAAGLARVIGDDRILLDAEVRRGSALACAGHWAEGQKVLEEALPLAEAVADLHCLYRALHNLGGILMDSGEFAPARAYCERALEVAERTGEQLGIMFALAILGKVLYLQGHWAQARTHLERALEMSRVVGWSLATRLIRESLAQLLVAVGDVVLAARCLEEGMTEAGLSANTWPRAQQLLAECELLEGRPEGALSRLIPLLDRYNADDRGADLLARLARAHLALGNNDEAGTFARRAVEQAKARNSRVVLAEALWAQAMVLVDERQWPEAARALEEGIRLTRDMPYPLAEARLLQLQGKMYNEQVDPESACESLEAALAIFRRLGM